MDILLQPVSIHMAILMAIKSTSQVYQGLSVYFGHCCLFFLYLDFVLIVNINSLWVTGFYAPEVYDYLNNLWVGDGFLFW